MRIRMKALFCALPLLALCLFAKGAFALPVAGALAEQPVATLGFDRVLIEFSTTAVAAPLRLEAPHQVATERGSGAAFYQDFMSGSFDVDFFAPRTAGVERTLTSAAPGLLYDVVGGPQGFRVNDLTDRVVVRQVAISADCAPNEMRRLGNLCSGSSCTKGLLDLETTTRDRSDWAQVATPRDPAAAVFPGFLEFDDVSGGTQVFGVFNLPGGPVVGQFDTSVDYVPKEMRHLWNPCSGPSCTEGLLDLAINTRDLSDWAEVAPLALAETITVSDPCLGCSARPTAERTNYHLIYNLTRSDGVLDFFDPPKVIQGVRPSLPALEPLAWSNRMVTSLDYDSCVTPGSIKGEPTCAGSHFVATRSFYGRLPTRDLRVSGRLPAAQSERRLSS